MEALKLNTSPADLLVKITTPYERVKTRFKEIPRPPSSITVSSPSSLWSSANRISTATTSTTFTQPSPDINVAALSISQIPQVFLVQKFYVSPGMSIDEKMQEVWTLHIKSRLSAVLLRNIPSGTCVQEFMMVGKRPNALKPTVFITCGDLTVKKRVEKVFKSQGWLQELLKTNHMGFIALIANTPLSAGPMSHDDGVETLDNSYAVQLPRPDVLTSCGLELLINGADSHRRQRCTLGGLLLVKARVFGLTAGHSFFRAKDVSLRRKLSEAVEDIDDSNDEESSSISSEPFVFDSDSDDNENDDLVDPNVLLFEHANTLPVPIDGLSCDRNTGSGSFLSVEWSVPQAAIFSLPHSKHLSSIEEPPNFFDWALLESLPLAVKVRPNAILDVDQRVYTPIEGISPSPACGRVVVSAASIEPQRGYLHNSPVTMQVEGSVLEVQLVVLESILPLGSSGAWVVHGDKLCGYIVAIRQDVPWAYMVAIQPILEDIGRRFKTDDVRLPTAVEIESIKSISQEPELTLPNMQEGTPPSELQSNQNAIPASGLTETRKAQKRSLQRYFQRSISEDIDETRNEISLISSRPASVLAQNQSINERSHVSKKQDELLSEKSSMTADAPRTSIVQWSPIHFELPGEDDLPTPYPLGQEVLNNSSPTLGTFYHELPEYHMTSMPSSTNLEAAVQASLRQINRPTSKIAMPLPFSQRFIHHLGQIWNGFEALILRIEYRRRRGRSRSSAFLVGMMWRPMELPDSSWIPDSMQRGINQWLYYSQYFTILMFGNILLNFLYCIFLFPFILWVLYRHHDVLERPRTQEQFRASMEMLGQLPERYNDYELLEQRVLRSMESGSVVF